MAPGEAGAFPPVGTRDRVRFAIAVEVAEGGALAPVMLVEVQPLERMQQGRMLGRGQGRDGGIDGEGAAGAGGAGVAGHSAEL